ncbi:hypothetical protein SNEBB_011337 [Seison nebaliae]|nr:hypothetical protein SNEBB_011337 [Seison nebaliae]
MGYRYAHEDNVLCTSWLTKEYLLSINYKGPLYLLGHSAIREELKNSGISFYTDELLMNEKGHFEKNEISTGDLCNKEKPVDQPITYDKGLVALDTLQPNILRDDITGVVLAFDSEITYEKMFKAINYICREKNEHYIITNQDMTFPSRHNDKNGKALVYPGTGSCLSSITECVDSVNPKKIPTIIGKPGNVLIRILNGIRKKSNLEEINVNECLMIGDRLDTDILWANNNKFAYTLHLTETGVNNLNDLERLTKINQELTPSFYTTSIQSFLNLLKD